MGKKDYLMKIALQVFEAGTAVAAKHMPYIYLKCKKVIFSIRLHEDTNLTTKLNIKRQRCCLFDFASVIFIKSAVFVSPIYFFH
jgi:hypothetical protein